MCSVPRVLYHHFDSYDLSVEVLSFSALAMVMAMVMAIVIVELVLEMIPDLHCELKSDVKLVKHSYVGLVSMV